jgi:hypothetical protein
MGGSNIVVCPLENGGNAPVEMTIPFLGALCTARNEVMNINANNVDCLGYLDTCTDVVFATDNTM